MSRIKLDLKNKNLIDNKEPAVIKKKSLISNPLSIIDIVKLYYQIKCVYIF